MIARVVVDIKHEQVNQIYDYLIKESDQDILERGMRVIVPFGEQQRLGYVVDVIDQSIHANKYIQEVLDITPTFDSEAFFLVQYLLKNPKTLLASAYQTVIPSDLLLHYEKRVELIDATKVSNELKLKFNTQGFWTPAKKDFKTFNNLRYLHEKGYINIQTRIKSRYQQSYDTYITLQMPHYHATPVQMVMIDAFKDKKKILIQELLSFGSRDVLNRLVKKGVFGVRLVKKQIEKSAIELNVEPIETTKVAQSILSSKHQKHFLHSMEDDSWIHLQGLIQENLENKKQVLFLVPEAHMVNRYYQKMYAYFDDTVIATMHYDQSTKMRMLNYESIQNGESQIIIGTRSSVFLPLSNLGLAVVMLAHDTSYRQEEGVYYDAVDILQQRLSFHQAKLVLTTHSPTLEQFMQIENKAFVFHQIKSEMKSQKRLIIDMKEELKSGHTSMLSRTLRQKIDEALISGQQVALMMNQKGYAPFVMCRSCGYVPQDPDYQIPLTYSERNHKLKSKFSKYEIDFTPMCANCQKQTVKPVGMGVELIESYMKKQYPQAFVVRVDQNTLRKKEDVIDVLSHIQSGRAQIIVGTQLIFKALKESNLGLIGVMMIDQILKLPYYDAFERAHLLLESTANYQADVYVQSYQSDHELLRFFEGHRMDLFYQSELKRRALANLPPYINMAQILLTSTSYLKAYQEANLLKQVLEKENMTVLGPYNAYILKKQDMYRVVLTLKYQSLSDEAFKLIDSYTHDEVSIYFYKNTPID